MRRRLSPASSALVVLCSHHPPCNLLNPYFERRYGFAISPPPFHAFSDNPPNSLHSGDVQMTEKLSLEYIINHVFLPPRLPQSSDSSMENDLILLDLVIRNAKSFAECMSSDAVRWGLIVRMLENLRSIYSTSTLDKHTLPGIVSHLTEGEMLVIPVRTQNACVFVRRLKAKTSYECFEIDPPNQQVMATQGRLVRRFPGPALEIADSSASIAFQREIIRFLADMDALEIEMESVTFKVKDDKDHETTDPHYITQFLPSMIHGFPDSKPADIERVEKRVRNEIMMYDVPHAVPWRRSPLWLVIRVAIQTTLRRGNSGGQTEFKSFIIFLLADVVLSSNECQNLSTDLLVCTQNKIVRRLRKLSQPALLLNKAIEAVGKVKEILEAKWENIRSQQALSPPWSPETLDLSHDTIITLLSSKDYLSSRLQQPPSHPGKPIFRPSEARRLNDSDFFHPELVSKALSSDPFVALADVEQFATEHLDSWIVKHGSNSSACVAFGKCILDYATTAERQYKDNPEDRSLMFLTIFLLWSAFDQMAIIHHPLLADYSPEVPENILDPILLRKFDSIQSLIRLREYLRGRHSRAVHGSVFDTRPSVSSFAIRHYLNSEPLIRLKQETETEAQIQRNEKLRELDRLKAEYNRLDEKAQKTEHDCYQSGYYRPWTCYKCLLLRQASELKIEIYEWPLPKDVIPAQATVFELRCPPVFQAWRTTTYTVLYDFCRPGVSNPGTSFTVLALADYRDLRAYCKPQSRITYASSRKPLNSSQRVADVTSDASVLVDNNLHFTLFDTKPQCWIKESFEDCAIDRLCKFRLHSSSPYYTLQYAMQKTTHSANQAIADQADVQPVLNIHEHIAFGTLRSGPVLQWLNILRELRARTLSFDRFEVHLLLVQTALETGNILGEELEWHGILTKPDFALVLLSEIDDLLSSIETNWHHTHTLQTLIILTSRLLESSSRLEDTVVVRACSTLRTARKTAFSWVVSLTQDLKGRDDEATITLMRQRICSAAATCRATYDIDQRYFNRLLVSDEDVGIFIQCAIRLQDNTPLDKLSDELAITLARDRRMSQRLTPIIRQKIQTSRVGLDNSVSAIWSDYQPGSVWEPLPAPNERWMTSTILDVSTATQSIVHYNLLNGTLLIDGKSLGRLPSSIVLHKTYNRILGHKILDVVPSTLPTMDFATRNAVIAPNVFLHFHLSESDGNLIIQAKVGVDRFELVPHTVFGQENQDFPSTFITEYVQWLHLSPAASNIGRITFHPLQSLWNPSENNWFLTFTPENGSGMMREGGNSRMVDIRSTTFGMIAKRLEPLEVPNHIHVIFDGKDTLLVNLPRYKMTFFVNESNDLECLTLRDMVVDLDQSSGTMFGLFNQLLLRDKSSWKTRIRSPGSRCVVIPFGPVAFEESYPNHTRIKILLDDGPRKYYMYQIDASLGRLIGTTLLSDLYKIYLHACTSFSLPDDLTERTGTEEALCELESARYLSFQDLTTEEANLLQDIARLTPGIKWHSNHLNTIQTIEWGMLGPLAQHWGFAYRVKDIFEFQLQLSSIGIGTYRDCAIHHTQSHLVDRLDSRTSGLYVPGRKAPRSYSDVLYPSPKNSRTSYSHRDAKEISSTTANVSAFSHHRSGQLDTASDLWERLQVIRVFKNEPRPSDSYCQFISPDLSDILLPFYEMCRQEQASETSISRVALALSLMVYTSFHNDQIRRLVPTFLSFARLAEFSDIDPPPGRIFNLSSGLEPNRTTLTNILNRYSLPPPTNQPARRTDENDYQYDTRRERYWECITRDQVKEVTDRLAQQWPCKAPSIPRPSHINLLNLSSSGLEAEILQAFLEWFSNMNFQKYIKRVQAVLDGIHVSLPTPIPSTTDAYQVPPWPRVKLEQERCIPTTLDDLLMRAEPQTPLISCPVLPVRAHAAQKQPSARVQTPPGIPEISRLQCLLEQYGQSSQALHHVYGDALQKSLQSLRGLMHMSDSPVHIRPAISRHLLEHDYKLRCLEYDNACQRLRMMLFPRTPLEVAESLAGQWPIPTTRSLLHLLSKDKLHVGLPSVWRDAITTLAQRLLKLQRSRRALFFKISDNEGDLAKELDNVDFEMDESFKNPEWLLIQIDSNFTVRPVQNHIAQEMILPRSGQNSLIQLNMGEGKSSVIVPLVSSALADGQKLVRVVILKPLVNQMFDLLVRRLSGLTNRRIFYLPFSRDFKPVPADLEKIQSLYEMCVHERGILLIQPEHILSFRLMGIDLAAGTCTKAAECLLRSHRWLSLNSRDVLDESDEILRATYQLVYTSGLQEPMDSHPDRWRIIQEVIGYALKHINTIQLAFPDGVEFHSTEDHGSPIIRILDSEAGDALIDSVVQEVLSNEKFNRIPPRLSLTASDFVRGRHCKVTAFKTLHNFLHDSNAWKHLLLYRGLLGHGLLHFVLREKRWRVDYGLDLTRTLLAVPYRAKDLPSLRADFGHPDVALLLTCLSYYYGGLTEEQLDKTFELLFKLDDPPLEYAEWISGQEDIPPSLRDIKGVNLDDEPQRKTILGPLFRKNKAVVDFFLSNVVFPRYAKQFPMKLSTSSWDLAETKAQVTTGFSGTNDNQYLLPTSIQQNDTTATGDHDPFGQLATNAKVLSILLRPENNTYCCLKGRDGHSPTGSDFLELLVKQTPPVRVLLDVGAQMLDMQNTELVSRWLSLVPEIHAIVYFNDNDELVVRSRDQHVEKFITSPYCQKLDLCAVYLDDAHTRGTDLKLPVNFRAAVTLGPKLTKDRLVQGCMRMRQLGRKQSVVFFAPPEVDRSIRACELSPLDSSAIISAEDILRWVMWQTCEHIQHYLPHWAQQGIEYKRRKDAWTLHEDNPSAPDALRKLRTSWEEPDARTLEEMYEMQPNIRTKAVHPAFQFSDLKERLDDLGVSQLGDPKTEEEQERQVSHEAERERQRELPPKVQPASSVLHKALELLIQSGIFNPDHTSSFIPLFSSLGKKHEWSEALFSTTDFATTIQGVISAGDFLRPVNWILSVPEHRALIVLSPFEVNKLLPMIWRSEHVHLHIYAPRVNRNMKTTEDLRFFSIPPLPTASDRLAFIPDPMLQLNLWAGQLYLKDFETYKQLCRVLGLIGAESGPIMWDSDGFVKAGDRTGAMKDQCRMVVSPVTFLKELFSLRRKGMGYTSTHMGKILDVRSLEEKDFNP